MTWGDALRSIGVGIFNSIIEAMSRMAAEFVVKQVIIRGAMIATHALGLLLQAKAMAIAAVNAVITFAKWIPGAIAASIGSYGAAAVIGTAAVAAVLGGLYAAGTFAEGGYTGPGNKYEPAGLVHRGEFVMDAETTQRVGVSRLEAMQKGEVMMDYGAGGQHITVYNVWSEAELHDRLLNSARGERTIVAHMSKNQHLV